MQRNSQSGQAAVLAMLCLFTLLVFVAMAANTGSLVSDRTRWQNTIDATAYSGAFEQARVLNKLTEINKEIVASVNDLRDLLNSKEWRQPPCACIDYSPVADQIIYNYQTHLDALAAQFDHWNKKGQETTKLAAKRTAGANLMRSSAADPRMLGFFEDNASSPTSWDVLVPVDRVTDTNFSYLYTKSCRCCNSCCPYPGYIREPLQLNTWMFKVNPEQLVFFPAKMRGTPAKRFFDKPGEGYFGGSSNGGMDMMNAYSAGKPYDGKMGTSDPGNDDWGPTYISGIEGSDFDNDNFRAEYRARVLGLKENMGSEPGVGRTDVTIAGMINTDYWAPEFVGKGEHFLH